MPATATTARSGHLDVGDTWLLGVEVRTDDLDADLTDATVTAVVTLPDNSTVSPTVTRTDLGEYLATYVLTTTGRHTAAVTVAPAPSPADPVNDVVLFAVDAMAPSGRPMLTDVQTYLGTVSYSSVDIGSALAAEIAAQSRVCRIGAVYDVDLAEALKRRVARNLAMRNQPLAVLRGDAEIGATTLPGRDPEIRRLEGPWRKVVFG
jgi:hypothetical protein